MMVRLSWFWRLFSIALLALAVGAAVYYGNARPSLEEQVDSCVRRVQVAINEGNGQVASAIAAELQAMSSSPAPYLMTILKEEADAERRCAAAFLLGELDRKHQQYVGVLIDVGCTDDNALVQQYALNAVDRLSVQLTTAQILQLCGLLRDSDNETVLQEAMMLLIDQQDRAAVASPVLINIIQGRHTYATANTKRIAITTLANVDPTSVRTHDVLLSTLEDPEIRDFRVIRSMRRRLGDRAKEAVHRLAQIAQSDKAAVSARLEAIDVIQEFADVIDSNIIKSHLASLLDDNEESVRRSAAAAMKKIESGNGASNR